MDEFSSQRSFLLVMFHTTSTCYLQIAWGAQLLALCMPRPMLQAEGCAECRIEVKLEAPIQDDLAHVVLGAGAIATYGTYPFQ